MKLIDKLVIRRLADLSEKGFIDGGVYSKVENAIKKDKDAGNSAIMVAINIVAFVFVALSCILFVNYNWAELGLFCQTAISITPIILFLLFGIFTIFRRFDSRLWNESACIFGFGSLIACALGVSAAYELNQKDYISVLMLLSIPIPIIFRSSFGALLISLMFCAFSMVFFQPSVLTTDTTVINIFPFILLAVILENYFLVFRNYTAGNFFDIIVSYADAVFLPIILSLSVSIVTNTGGYFLLCVLIFIAVFSFGTLLYQKRNAVLVNGFLIGGGVALSITMLIFAFPFKGFFDFNFMAVLGSAYWPIIAGWWICACAAVAAILYNLYRGGGIIIISPILILLAFLPRTCSYSEIADTISVYIANAGILFFALCLFLKGIRGKSAIFINMGIALFIAYAIARSLNANLPMLIRSVVLLILGLSALLFNVIWYKIRNSNRI